MERRGRTEADILIDRVRRRFHVPDPSVRLNSLMQETLWSRGYTRSLAKLREEEWSGRDMYRSGVNFLTAQQRRIQEVLERDNPKRPDWMQWQAEAVSHILAAVSFNERIYGSEQQSAIINLTQGDAAVTYLLTHPHDPFLATSSILSIVTTELLQVEFLKEKQMGYGDHFIYASSKIDRVL